MKMVLNWKTYDTEKSIHLSEFVFVEEGNLELSFKIEDLYTTKDWDYFIHWRWWPKTIYWIHWETIILIGNPRKRLKKEFDGFEGKSAKIFADEVLDEDKPRPKLMYKFNK